MQEKAVRDGLSVCVLRGEVKLPGNTKKILLKGVVSRKKQMIPVLVTYLQQK